MSEGLALWLSIGAGGLAILFGIVSTQWVLKQPAGNERMQEIAAAIQEGAKAYMNRQYLTISVVGVVLSAARPTRTIRSGRSSSPSWNRCTMSPGLQVTFSTVTWGASRKAASRSAISFGPRG